MAGWEINRNIERELWQYMGDSLRCLVSDMEKVLHLRFIIWNVLKVMGFRITFEHPSLLLSNSVVSGKLLNYSYPNFPKSKARCTLFMWRLKIIYKISNKCLALGRHSINSRFSFCLDNPKTSHRQLETGSQVQVQWLCYDLNVCVFPTPPIPATIRMLKS